MASTLPSKIRHPLHHPSHRSSPSIPRHALPPVNAPNSPYATEDKGDGSSKWDDETNSDSGTTATDSPWLRSPLHLNTPTPRRSTPACHDNHDKDDEDTGPVVFASRPFSRLSDSTSTTWMAASIEIPTVVALSTGFPGRKLCQNICPVQIPSLMDSDVVDVTMT